MRSMRFCETLSVCETFRDRSFNGARMISVEIGGLELPEALVATALSGKWGELAQSSRIGEVFGDSVSPSGAAFFGLATLVRANEDWRARPEVTKYYLGSLGAGITINQTLLIVDLGHEGEQLVALDYRTTPHA